MMNTQAFSDWSAWAGPWMELQQMNQTAAEKIIRECISFYSDNAATAVKCTQSFQRINNPEDFFNAQMKLMSSQGEKNLEFLQNISKIYQDVFKDHCRWTEDKVSSAVKNASKSVKRQSEEDK